MMRRSLDTGGLAPPTSPNAEGTTIQAPPGRAQQLYSQEVPISENEFASECELLQSIEKAIQSFDWQTIQKSIPNLGYHGYEQLLKVSHPTEVGIIINKGNALHLCISEFSVAVKRNGLPQKEDLLNTVKALVDGAPSEELKVEMVNKTYIDGRTPLHMVVASTFDQDLQVKLVNYLLNKGAIATIQDENGDTPLHLAAASLCEGSVRVLLDIFNAKQHKLYNPSLRTPLDLARLKIGPDNTQTPNPSNSVPQHYQPLFKLLEDYQNEKQGINVPERSQIGRHDSSNPWKASVHILRSTSPCKDSTTNQSKQFYFEDTEEIPMNELIYGLAPRLEGLACQKFDFNPFGADVRDASSTRKRESTISGPYWPTWIDLPAHNLPWIQDAVDIVFGKESDMANRTRQFIHYMIEKDNFVQPGFYMPDNAHLIPVHLQMECLVIPVLEVNTRAPLHCRGRGPQDPNEVQPGKTECLHDSERQAHSSAATATERQCPSQSLIRSRSWNVYGENVLSLEQTLDEYCHRSLSNDKLDKRDRDQVLFRHFNKDDKQEQKHEEEGRSMHILRHFKNLATKLHAGKLDKTPGTAVPNGRSEAENTPKSRDRANDAIPIVVVSNLVVWKFGDLVITTLNGVGLNYDPENADHLKRKIWSRCSTMKRPQQHTAPDTARMLVQCIMEESVKHEPSVRKTSEQKVARLLDGAGPFASEIASESQSVTEFFEKYPGSLGQVEATYKNSVPLETELLLRLDDILNELAMIRRVREDARLVCLDALSDDKSSYKLVDSWRVRGRSKLDRLEGEATRVRQSLVTLLSLKQREVNAESLINSKFQSQVLFVFTAATVLFTPLSWISSLMALNIEGFTPAGSKWSMNAAAASSCVTLTGFIFLMGLALLVWHISEQPKSEKKTTSTDEKSSHPDQHLGRQNTRATSSMV